MTHAPYDQSLSLMRHPCSNMQYQALITRDTCHSLVVCVTVSKCLMSGAELVLTFLRRIRLSCLRGRGYQGLLSSSIDEVASREPCSDNNSSKSCTNTPCENKSEDEGNTAHRSWACDSCPCPLELWVPCDGPLEPGLDKVWNIGGMFDYENSNEMGWNGGQWPPR